jgi:site-specific DNA recombinase
MKAILIARVSTEEQREAGNSLPAQEARLNKYCQNKGFEVLKMCSFDESAYKDQRSTFDGIIDFIFEQKEKVVVCFDKVDRLSRNIFDKRIAMLYEKALNDEIELHFVSDGQVINSRNSSADKKFQFTMSLGLAKYYSDAISDNVNRAFEQKIRKGEWLSRAPFGYKNITKADETKDIVVDEHAAHIIQKVFELYATGAFSMELLCKKVKEEYGINWPKGYLGKLLKNPFYHGIMIINKTRHPHRYPPLISQVLFDQARKVADGFKKKPFKYAGKPYVYRGMLRCGHCGCAITPEKHKGYVYYHCTQYKGKHGAKWFREEKITEQLGHVFKNMQMPKNILQQIVDTLNSVHKDKIEFHNKHFDQLTSGYKALTKKMDNMYEDKLEGKISEDQYDRFYQKFRDEKNDISLRLEKLQDAEDNYYITAKHVLDLSSRAYELFLSSEMEERRQLLKLVLSNLRIEDEKVLCDVQAPFDLILNCHDRKSWRESRIRTCECESHMHAHLKNQLTKS